MQAWFMLLTSHERATSGLQSESHRNIFPIPHFPICREVGGSRQGKRAVQDDGPVWLHTVLRLCCTQGSQLPCTAEVEKQLSVRG